VDQLALIYRPGPTLMKQIENGADQDIFSCNPAIGTVADVAEA
jgi:hypothetical protein